MDKSFCIKSESFSLYKAFREEAEKVGWQHNAEFTPFKEDNLTRHNCLFFHSEWERDGWSPKFAFSNSNNNVFKLPEDWHAAIDHMKKVYQSGKPKEKLSISLKNLADHHGVSVDDIIITS